MAQGALLFDIEGTLCDTRRWYEQVLASEFGCSPDDVRTALMNGRAPTLLAADNGIGRNRFLQACRSRAADLVVYPGVQKTLCKFADRATPTAAITNLPPALADEILRAAGLRNLLRVVVAWQRGVPPKPHPAPLRLAMHKLRVEPAESVYYIGDMETDALAAIAAGVRFAWAAYGYSSVCPSGTAVTVRRFSQLANL